MEIYLKLFEVLFPVFLIVGLGYHLGKKNPDFDTSFITTYAGNFGTPALVIFAITAGGVTFELFSEYFGYAIILLTLFGIVGLIFLVLMKKDYIRELPTFILPNTGNMGIPICLFAYGELGMGIAAAISSLIVLLHFTLNIFLAKRAFDFKTILKSPSFYAILITVLILYLLALGLFIKSWHRWLMPIGIIFHIFIYLLIPVRTFSLTMILLYISFLDPKDVNYFLKRI